MIETAQKKDVRLLDIQQLTTFFTEHGEKAFRARQVFEWIWKKSASSFDIMTNIPKAAREMLSEHFAFNNIQIHKEQFSSDGTVKSAFKLHDDNVVEGVLIPADHRTTACISSQVGCSLSCKFCATGYLERKRNLNPAEIYDQVVLINQQSEQRHGRPLSNIVFMGMGEPLLNYNSVLKAIGHITSEYGLGMSPKRITVSTAGIAKMIHKLADDEVKFNLALSLHAANEEKRNQIMPINETNNLAVLKDALQYFYKKTRNKITLEYIAFDKFNDDLEDARDLVKFATGIPCKVNIIEYNTIDQASFNKSSFDRLEHFKAFLEKKGLIVNIRRSRGKDIDAACGQLANKN